MTTEPVTPYNVDNDSIGAFLGELGGEVLFEDIPIKRFDAEVNIDADDGSVIGTIEMEYLVTSDETNPLHAIKWDE